MGTIDRCTLYDDPTPHTGPEGQHHHAVILASGANPVLPVGGRRTIIGKSDRGLVTKSLEFISYRVMAPARQVRWLEDQSCRNIHRSRSSQADSRQVVERQAVIGE
jgi:hypothetical protein